MNGFFRNMIWDLRSLHRSGVALVSVLVIFIACGLAMQQGLSVAQIWQDEVITAQTNVIKSNEALHKNPPKTPEAVAITLFMTRPTVILPPAPLLGLATGRSDLEPRVGQAGAFKQRNVMFRNYQIEGPIQVALGKFDLAFVIQWLLPLIILGLGYGLLTEDRSRGIDRLLLVQGTSMWRIAIARLCTRTLLTLIPMLIVLAVLYLIGLDTVAQEVNRGQRLLWASLLISAYIIFWWSVVLWINSWRLGRSQTLVILVLVWVITALVLPALAGVASRSMHPSPSRHAFVAESRAHEIEATKRSSELMGDYVHDHPELDAERADKLPWWVGIHLVSVDVDQSLESQANHFITALEQQQEAVRMWRFSSPALMLQQGLTALAGTDEARFAEFRKQAYAFHNDFRQAAGKTMMIDQSLDVDAFQRMSQFSFIEPDIAPARNQVLLSISLLGLLSLFLALHAASRLRKVQ